MANKIDAKAIKGLETGVGSGSGSGGIPEAPLDGYQYGRQSAAWTRITGSSGGGGGVGAGSFIAFPSRAAAEAATIASDISHISLVHSGQVLHYRRYTPVGSEGDWMALKSNGGTVNWAPASDVSFLHWGAAGDGYTNDRIAIQNCLRFFFGTPATNGQMPTAFDNQRPFQIIGHNRVYAIAAPIIMGNLGTDVDTGMVYNLRLSTMRFKAIDGDWQHPLLANVPLRYMLMAGWNFQNDYSDAYSGIYDVMLDHVSFDMNFKAGGRWICNTYQWVEHECRWQHPGENQVVLDTSIRTANQGTRPFGYNTGNGAHTIIRPNIEGRVGESGEEYPSGEDITTMGTIGIRVHTNDCRIDGAIVSGVTSAMHLLGGAIQLNNIHPWSREVIIGPYANNIMITGAYLDYTKFILESFSHMFVGCHWIIPGAIGLDRGVELRASKPNETGAGLLFSGCTFGGESLDIRYTTTGEGSWVGEKNRMVTIKSCKYLEGHTIAQIERFENKHGFTPASGAHWFRTGDASIGEIRLVGDTLYVGKDRTVAGPASVQLQGMAGDQPGAGLYAYTLGGLGLTNFTEGGFIDIGTFNTPSALFISGTTGNVVIKEDMVVTKDIALGGVITVGRDRTTAGSAAIRLQSKAGTDAATLKGVLAAYALGGMEMINYMSGGYMALSTALTPNAIYIDGSTGDVTIEKKLTVKGGMSFATLSTTGLLSGGGGVDVKSTSGQAALRFLPAGSSSAMGAVTQAAGGLMSLTNYAGAWAINTSGKSNALFIESNGNATFAGTLKAVSYSNTSDARLKEDFKEIDPSIIDLIKIYGFKYKHHDIRSFGVMAHELEEHLPELISENEDGIKHVDYIGLFAISVAKIQQLEKRIKHLETKH